MDGLNSMSNSGYKKRITKVIESIDDGNGGVISKIAAVSTLVDTCHYNINKPGENLETIKNQPYYKITNLASIAKSLLNTKRRVSNAVVNSMASHLGHTSFERYTSTKGRLLEKHEEGFAFQSMGIFLWVLLKVLTLIENSLDLAQNKKVKKQQNTKNQ